MSKLYRVVKILNISCIRTTVKSGILDSTLWVIIWPDIKNTIRRSGFGTQTQRAFQFSLLADLEGASKNKLKSQLVQENPILFNS